MRCLPSCKPVERAQQKLREYSHQACNKKNELMQAYAAARPFFQSFNQAALLTFLHHFSARQGTRSSTGFITLHTFRTTNPPVE